MGELTKEDILRKWEDVHGALPDPWRQQFLERGELIYLTKCTESDVESAIKKSPRLEAITIEVYWGPGQGDRVPCEPCKQWRHSKCVGIRCWCVLCDMARSFREQDELWEEMTENGEIENPDFDSFPPW